MARITRQESQDITRQCLRTAARGEFAQYGVAGASIDRITEAAGYSRGAFYSNYSSKSELALELLSENNSLAIAQWRALIDESLDPATLLQHLEKQFDLDASQRHWWLLAVELRLEAERSPEFGKRFETVNGEIRQQLLEMIRSLCRATGCEASVDPDYITFVVHTFTHGLQFERGTSPDRFGSPGKLFIRLVYDLLGRPAGFKLSR
ncbi:TetR/AcrR family transcriptional regulator [Pseudomonas izuensis]|uniref:TetR/AcrR family transcriptional regulator n=1 Tax=Pseudomonas izuensis TaxID=2684212 RepID=UPI0013589EC2|nr:TetR family transcriptional regulator [Pseudomonas izuensis]